MSDVTARMGMSLTADIAVVGGGAAGLMAAIWAGRTRPGRSIVLLDGATRLGAKIMVSGGGRCNVTHDVVEVEAFCGSSREAIRKVLRRFEVGPTIEFFRELGVELKREETGKLFPVTDDARTVLEALLGAAEKAGVRILTGHRVARVARRPDDDGGGRFVVAGEWGEMTATNVVIATGGKSLPKTGSDGHGFEIARSLGHSVTARVFAALVPLTLPKDHFVVGLSGVATPVVLEVQSATRKRLAAIEGAMLCTHFGISGPAAMDVSRHFIDARFDDPGARLVVNWLPGETMERLESAWREAGVGAGSPMQFLRRRLPERLAKAVCESVDGVDVNGRIDQLRREARRNFARALTAMTLPVTGDRGFAHAEVTAGGVPLKELRLETMESRLNPGLYLCGEICDVDGRIGGYNFQWAWASGFVAGVSVGR